MDRRQQLVERALAYPYGAPQRSFALAGARVLGFAEIEVDRSTRTPLLAYGSNASPPVLSRKLAPIADPVPVVRAELRDYDVVYSAHIAAYGSVPATLRRSPGTEVPAFLTDEQMRLIAATEPNYELRQFVGLSCRLESGEALTSASAYVSRHGCLLASGDAVALAAVGARARTFVALDQRQVLELVRDVLRPGVDLERFILDCIAGEAPATTGLDRSEAP